MPFPDEAFVYCDKWTGKPVINPSEKVYLLKSKPTELQCRAQGYQYNTQVIVRRIQLTFIDDFKH